ncbi:MAG: hypothetical protein ACXWC9_09735, partial [Pseudobdellovibrionaceae bacterium]
GVSFHHVPILEIPVNFVLHLPESMRLLSIQHSMLSNISTDVLKTLAHRQAFTVDLSENTLLNKKKIQEDARKLGIERQFIF